MWTGVQFPASPPFFYFSNFFIVINHKYKVFICKKYNLDKNSQRKDVFNVFITLSCFLEEQEFIQLNNSLSKRINKLKKQVSEKHFKKIISSIGFTEELEKIKQNNAKTHQKNN